MGSAVHNVSSYGVEGRFTTLFTRLRRIKKYAFLFSNWCDSRMGSSGGMKESIMRERVSLPHGCLLMLPCANVFVLGHIQRNLNAGNTVERLINKYFIWQHPAVIFGQSESGLIRAEARRMLFFCIDFVMPLVSTVLVAFFQSFSRFSKQSSCFSADSEFQHSVKG